MLELEKFSALEVESFISLWNSSNTFWSDYEISMLPSFDSQQLCILMDGRRNPDWQSFSSVAIIRFD
ncbi:hypothetical protein FRX31_022998, partial [Thalictrum thalictroides]